MCLGQDSEAVKQGAGQNIIPQPEKEPLWKGFLKKFEDPLIVVLLVVFVFSVAVSLYEILEAGRSWINLLEPLGVLTALLLATGIGFIFEVKAAREFDVLNQKKDERYVKVFRWAKGANRAKGRPQMCQVKRSDVVVGDIVRLESGDEVPPRRPPSKREEKATRPIPWISCLGAASSSRDIASIKSPLWGSIPKRGRAP